jgi:cell division septation protein DedD
MPEPTARAQDAASLDSSPTMAMTTLYSAAVGPIGNDYYLPLFSRFEAAGQATLSWNLSACLYSINWMIFRRLWGPALVFAGVMLGASVLLVALGLLVFEWPHDLIYQLLLACLALGMLTSGVWGNALFYNRCRQAMMTAVADNKTLVQACAQLSQRASTRKRFIRLLLVNSMLLALAAAAYVRLVGFDSADTPAPDTAPAPALAASAAEPAASAASQAASTASEPASAVSAPEEASALSAVSAASGAASAPGFAPVAVSASAPLAVAASAPASVPMVLPAATKLAAPAVRPASGPARGRNAAPASAHASATAHTASKPATHTASKPVARAASKPAAKVALAKAPKAIPAKATQPAKTAPAKSIYINAGLFANPDNARNALAKLQAAGLPAFAQELETSQGTRTRIRVGPMFTPAQAEATIQQIKALNLDAALVKP